MNTKQFAIYSALIYGILTASQTFAQNMDAGTSPARTEIVSDDTPVCSLSASNQIVLRTPIVLPAFTEEGHRFEDRLVKCTFIDNPFTAGTNQQTRIIPVSGARGFQFDYDASCSSWSMGIHFRTHSGTRIILSCHSNLGPNTDMRHYTIGQLRRSMNWDPYFRGPIRQAPVGTVELKE